MGGQVCRDAGLHNFSAALPGRGRRIEMVNQFFRQDYANGDIHQDVIGYAMKMRGVHTLQGEQRPA